MRREMATTSKVLAAVNREQGDYRPDGKFVFDPAAASPDDLTRIVDFFGMMQMPAVSHFSLTNNHSIHHRGQLSAYLRAMGSKVPDIYGSSGDSQ
ncbi:MAG: hypothetical protein FJW21_00075 [Acidimicrobiia bacterium]|nr:hypothetical protein [Acidimicrobiia bacterium]